MTVHMTRLGTNDDGSPHYHIYSDDPTKALVWTGPIMGTVVLPDGTGYDITAPMIEVEPGHELLVSDAIGERHQAEGHPGHDGDKPFVHTPATVTHTPDGAPSPAFAAAVEGAIPPDEDSSPRGVMQRAETPKGA